MEKSRVVWHHVGICANMDGGLAVMDVPVVKERVAARVR